MNGSLDDTFPSHQIRPDGARLLSLDGGGVKGISSITILKAIMDRVRDIEISEDINSSAEPRKPVDYFDLAAGTSTGGLMALMLFRLRMSAEQTQQAYVDLAKDIFARTFLGSKLLGTILGNVGLMIKVLWNRSMYAAKPLEKAIKRVVEQYSDPKDPDMMRLVHPRSGKMFMCATLETTGESVLLRTYPWPSRATPITGAARKAKNDGHLEDIDIISAARATSAAPVYLPEEVWKDIHFWDGGLLNNNPIQQAWNTRYDLVAEDARPPKVSCVLSLGCGVTVMPHPHFIFHLLNIGITYVGVQMVNSEAKHLDFERLVNRMKSRGDENSDLEYFRLNVDQKGKIFDMADYRIMDELRKMTEQQIQSPAWQEQIDKCARLLVTRK